ncbi:MAG: winged helix-turn-helix domain-containing protein [Myxococcota bacterium]
MRLKLLDATVDLEAREVSRADGVRMPLTPTDVALLQRLARPGVVSASALRRCLPRGGALPAAIFRLRTRLEADPDHPRNLITHHGRGYALATGGDDDIGSLVDLVADRVADTIADGIADGVRDRVRLTTRERQLLGCLAEANGRTVGRAELAERLGIARRPDAIVSALRRKLAHAGQDGRVQTVHGGGYRWRTLGARSNLPIDDDAFVGNPERLAETLEGRWTALWGPAGVGKSRTARELCRRRGGGWWVDATGVRSPDALVLAAVRALGGGDVRASTARLLDAAAAVLGDQHPALVIDELDPAAADGVRALIAAASSLRVWSTSRERPSAGHPVEVRPLDPDEARALYLARARRIDPTLTLSEREDGALDEGLAKVDRLPLAIELLAARIDVMRPGDFARGLAPLEGARAALEPSWRALDRDARRALGLATVFHGPFEPEALDGVTRPGAAEALARRSLLRRAAIGDERLLANYELVRGFVTELRPPSDEDRRAVARWMVAVVRRLRDDVARREHVLQCLRERMLDVVAAVDHADPEDLWWLAWATVQARSHTEALVEAVNRRFPGSPEALAIEAWWRALQNLPELGAELVQRAIAAGADPGTWWMRRVRAHLALGRADPERFCDTLGPRPPGIADAADWYKMRVNFALNFEGADVHEPLAAEMFSFYRRHGVGLSETEAWARITLAQCRDDVDGAERWASAALAAGGAWARRYMQLTALLYARLAAGRRDGVAELLAQLEAECRHEHNPPAMANVAAVHALVALRDGDLDLARNRLHEADGWTAQMVGLPEYRMQSRLMLALVVWAGGSDGRPWLDGLDHPLVEQVRALFDGRAPPEPPRRDTRDGVLLVNVHAGIVAADPRAARRLHPLLQVLAWARSARG